VASGGKCVVKTTLTAELGDWFLYHGNRPALFALSELELLTYNKITVDSIPSLFTFSTM
jgi:hypothetical protein